MMYLVEDDPEAVVLSYEEIQKLRNENIQLAKLKKPIRNIIPQEGFQEDVILIDADIKIIGGKRGGGKTAGMEILPMQYINNPLYKCFGFRREESDIKRGLWSTSEKLYEGLATPVESSFTWRFPSGAQIIFEHLENEEKVDQRFRGAELATVLIDELPQIKQETFFTLLGSNRNTVGVPSEFIGTCNPVDDTHWLYQLIRYYVNEETGEINLERNKKVRFFFKEGDTVDKIVWGDSKEEVYQKAKHAIDLLVDPLDADSHPHNFISSLAFIEGDFRENPILKAQDPSYMARLAQQGGMKAIKDIKGLWGMAKESSSEEISDSDFMSKFLYNDKIQLKTKDRFVVADIASKNDLFTLFYFEDKKIVDIEWFNQVGFNQATMHTRDFLSRHNVSEENFVYDGNGLGVWFEEEFPKSISFINQSAPSDRGQWDSLKSECAQKLINSLKLGEFSIDPIVRERNIKIKNKIYTVGELLLREKKALQRKDTNSYKFELIQKKSMIAIVGWSPNFIDSMIMRMTCENRRKKRARNLGML